VTCKNEIRALRELHKYFSCKLFRLFKDIRAQAERYSRVCSLIARVGKNRAAKRHNNIARTIFPYLWMQGNYSPTCGGLTRRSDVVFALGR